MSKITFQQQLCLGIAIVFLGLLLSTMLQRGVFSNIGAVLYGALFVIHPVHPVRCQDIPRMRSYIRLAGALVMALGALTRFGV